MSTLQDLEAAARELIKKHPGYSYLTLWELLYAEFPGADENLIGVALMAALDGEQ